MRKYQSYLYIYKTVTSKVLAKVHFEIYTILSLNSYFEFDARRLYIYYQGTKTWDENVILQIWEP